MRPADPARDAAHATLVDALGDRFVSATLSGALADTSPPAQKVTVRPVELREGHRVQFSSFDGRRTTVVNIEPHEARAHFGELLAGGFANAYVRTLDGDLQLTHSRRGRPMLVRHRASASQVDTAHDRPRARLVSDDAPFLRAFGITDDRGRVKPAMRAKHRQVARFVEILAAALDAVPEPPAAGARFVAVDLGCGAGVLTAATYHYLTEVRGLDVSMTGVDTNAELLAKVGGVARALGWDGLTFTTGSIADHEPVHAPDLVIALHACDTATDDALARAVGWGAQLVLAAPCCQHDLQAQLDRRGAPEAAAPLLRHGIVRERLGDLLTDALRAEIMRGHGYRTDVIEFVSTEHTGKNLMIRAVRGGTGTGAAHEAGAAAAALAGAWGVEPALARRIGYAATAASIRAASTSTSDSPDQRSTTVPDSSNTVTNGNPVTP
jgi:SAM-dependent methyltransferase